MESPGDIEVLELGYRLPYFWKPSVQGIAPTGRIGHSLLLYNDSLMILSGGMEIRGDGTVQGFATTAWLLLLPEANSCVRGLQAKTVVNDTACPLLPPALCQIGNGCTLDTNGTCVDICLGHGYEDCYYGACEWRSPGAYHWRRLVTANGPPGGLAFMSALPPAPLGVNPLRRMGFNQHIAVFGGVTGGNRSVVSEPSRYPTPALACGA